MGADAAGSNVDSVQLNNNPVQPILPGSPAMLAKTNITPSASTAEPRQQTQLPLGPAGSLTSRTVVSSPVEAGSPRMGPFGGSTNQPHLTSSSSQASPLAMGSASRDSRTPSDTLRDALHDMHLSGHEPRYFPGVVTRSQRRNSMRKSSTHESDDNAMRKASGRKEVAPSGSNVAEEPGNESRET
jgi:AMP deaminase